MTYISTIAILYFLTCCTWQLYHGGKNLPAGEALAQVHFGGVWDLRVVREEKSAGIIKGH